MSRFRELVTKELARARAKHPVSCTNTIHGGYAVILEEVDEFWDEVRRQTGDRDPELMLQELVQIAAMAERVAEDCQLIQEGAE